MVTVLMGAEDVLESSIETLFKLAYDLAGLLVLSSVNSYKLPRLGIHHHVADIILIKSIEVEVW